MIDYSLFESAPGCRLAFFTNAPTFTIAAVSNDFVNISGIKKEQAVGKPLFEIFGINSRTSPPEPLNAALNNVIRHRCQEEVLLRDFELMNTGMKQDWQILHLPVLNGEGEINYIIQHWEVHTKKETPGAKEIGSKDIDQFHRLFMTAPIVIGVVKGDDYIIELANDSLLEIWNRTPEAIGKPLLRAIPELKGQGFIELLDEVRRTGRPYIAKEAPIRLVRHGKEELLYMNFVYEAFYDDPPAEKATGVIAIGYDVTEHVLARIKEQESRHQLELAVEIAELGTFQMDIASDKVYSSERLSRWFGLTGQSYQRQQALASIHPEDRDRVRAATEITLQSEADSRHDIKFRVINKEDDTVRHLHSVGKTLFSREGEPYRIIGIIQDVTEQVLHQKQLEENESLLQQRVKERTEDLDNQKALISSILNASLDGIYALKALHNAEGAITDFQYLFANDYISRSLHVSPEKLIGSSMLSILPENSSNGFFDLFCRSLNSGQTFRDETHFVSHDIDSWFDFAVVPIDTETLVVSILDISERKKSSKQIEEQRNLLNSILQNSSNGISVSEMIRDESGMVIDALTILANDAAVKYTGLPKEIYLSKSAREIEPGILDSPYYAACIKTLETGQPFVMQYRLEATGHWLELTVSKLDDDHLIHIFTDVTPIKEAQLQLEKSVEELKRSNQNLEQFAYAASHDLKEPMRKIQLFSDRLKNHLEGTLDKEHQHYFDRILQSSDRMTTLINDLLVYSTVSKGALLDEEADLNEIVKTVLEDLELEIEDNKASISVGPLPTVKGNRRQLQQVFQNLIGNAIKYRNPTVENKVWISSKVVTEGVDKLSAVHADKQSYYSIEIRDNGIGFDPKDAERIFDVFTRLHDASVYKGTGVGLSIVRKVAENHGGFVVAEGQPGKGSSFKLMLPF